MQEGENMYLKFPVIVWLGGGDGGDVLVSEYVKDKEFERLGAVKIDNGFVYLIDDDVSINDINSSYCWFKARSMKYRAIPDW